MNAFESVRLKPEPMPPLVRALLYPANSPSARIPVSPTPRVGSKWRTGKPLHAGWWLTRLGYSKAEWRWWDGERRGRQHLWPYWAECNRRHHQYRRGAWRCQ